jgi:pantetheine-phosphate adenylyltransferase
MAVERTGVYPGTFDPITSGHMEVVRRSLRLVDKLVIGPAMSISKGPMFSLEERIDIIKDDISDFPQADRDRIEIVPFEGLLIHFARQVNASVIIRGLRAVSDFEYEIQMANMNARMEPAIETIFLMASDRHQFISSRFVKEIGSFGGNIRHFVSPRVADYLEKELGFGNGKKKKGKVGAAAAPQKARKAK